MIEETACESVDFIEKEGHVVGCTVKLEGGCLFKINLEGNAPVVDNIVYFPDEGIDWNLLKEHISSTSKVRVLGDFLSNWDNVKQHVCVRFAGTYRLKDVEYMNTVVVKDVLNLKATFYVENAVEGTYVTITGNLFKSWNISLEELWEFAWANTLRLHPVRMNEICSLPPSRTREDRSCSYVLSSGDSEFGAIHMLNKDYLKELAQDIGANDFLLVPTSIHSVIIFPDMDYEYLKQLACIFMKDPSLSEKDTLPACYYIYNYERDEITFKENGREMVW